MQAREIPINRLYHHHLIATKVNDIFIYSIEPKLYEDFKIYISSYKIKENDELISVLDKFFKNRISDYSIRRMYRLSFDKEKLENINNTKSVKLTKEILMNSLKQKDDKEKEEIWNRKKKEVEEGRQYVILEKDKIISWCKVSNIDYSGGNLVVWTAPEHRRKGYGKDVGRQGIKWCINNNIIPIYLVDSLNKASINLAKTIGFKIKSEEIVVTTKV